MRHLATAALVLLILCLNAVALHAQPDPVEWGEVPREQLAMEHFAADSNAAAVILADYGTAYFRFNGEIEFERHRRIKILTEAGYEQAEVAISFYDEDRLERVRKIEGQTFVLGPGGEVQRYELDGDDIFEEDVDSEGYKRMRFTLPALAPGAVVEYRYQVRSKNPLFLRGWTFQSDEPTLWSEYRVTVPNVLKYARQMQAPQPFYIQEKEQVNSRHGLATAHRWVMRDMPALREEPFMTTPEDFRARIRFQLQRIQPEYGRGATFYASWEELADELMDHDAFGNEIDRHKEVRRRARAILMPFSDPTAQMEALYTFVQRSMQWNGERGMLVNQDLDDALEAKTGSQAELALILLSMLHEAGIEAHPVLISTRAHGRTEPHYPFLQQFNGVLVHATVGEKTYLLDATDPKRPYHLLPVEALNHRGLLIRDGTPEWIGIEPAQGLTRRVLVRGQVTADGTLEATLEASDEAYSALRRRHSLDERAARAFVQEEVLDGLAGAVVERPTIEHQTVVSEPLGTNVSFTVPGYAQAAGGFLYLNPMVVGRMTENPLRQPERTFPVDIAYPRDLTYTLALRLPQGYVLREQPPNMQVKLPNDAGTFQRLVRVSHGALMMQSRFMLNKTVFAPEEYEAIRELFARVVQAHAEQVVLQHVEEPAAASEAAAQPEEAQ